MKQLIFSVATVYLMMLTFSSAYAQSARLQTYGLPIVWNAHADWCKRNPFECQVHPERREVSFQEIERVNREVNRLITRKSDHELYGVEEYWGVKNVSGRFYGDCEDYALRKKEKLLRLGMPSSRLRLVHVSPADNGPDHVSLVFEWNGDYLILDDGTDAIQSVTYYALKGTTFNFIQTTWNPRMWRRVSQPDTDFIN